MSNYVSLFVILILLAVVSVSIKAGWVLSHPQKVMPDESVKREFATLVDITFKDVENKHNLSGWFVRAENSDKMIIFVHGYKSNRMIFNKSTPDFIKEALRQNYNVLAFDFRGNGKSDGDTTTFGYYEKNDLLGAINYAKGKGAKHIVLLGISMGGATAIITASSNPQMVDGIVSDSAFAELKPYLYRNLPAWSSLPTFPFSYAIIPAASFFAKINPSDVSPLNAIGNIPPEKVMLIHSEDDTVVPYEECLKIFKASYSATKLLVVKSAPHGKIFELNKEIYLKRVFKFINERVESAETETPVTLPNIPNIQIPNILQNDFHFGRQIQNQIIVPESVVPENIPPENIVSGNANTPNGEITVPVQENSGSEYFPVDSQGNPSNNVTDASGSDVSSND